MIFENVTVNYALNDRFEKHETVQHFSFVGYRVQQLLIYLMLPLTLSNHDLKLNYNN